MKDKSLKDLKFKEIGKLFPIEIIPYNDQWPDIFEQEKKLITDTLHPAMVSRIEHFGSTAIPGLSSKDIIDILMEVEFKEDTLQKLIKLMESICYEFFWQNESDYSYIVFVKGYTIAGIKQQKFHIHAGHKNLPIWDRLYFKNYLIEHPEKAKAYEALKKKLAEKFKEDRLGYRTAKTEFIKHITDIAKNSIAKY